MKKTSDEKRHAPCKYRRREARDGVTLDWCYAIGCCEMGDMPCEYCADRKEYEDAGKESSGKAGNAGR